MANQQTFTLTISRVDQPIFDGEAVSVSVPGVNGEMQLLANHEAFITPLKAGVVTTVKADGETDTHEIKAGTLEVSNNHVTILI